MFPRNFCVMVTLAQNLRSERNYIDMFTVLFYAKNFLSAEERFNFYSSYQHDHDTNYSTAQEIQPSTARER